MHIDRTLRSVLLAALLAGTAAAPADAQPSAVREGAAWGATVGMGAVGLLFGTFARGLCDAAVCEGSFAEGFVPGAVTGAVAGGLLGALIGALARTEPGEENAHAPRGLRFDVAYGRPRLSGAGPYRGASLARAGLGHDVARPLAVGLGATFLDVKPEQIVRPLGFDDDDARATSILATAHAHIAGGAVRIGVAAGPVHSSLTRRSVRGGMEVGRQRSGAWGAAFEAGIAAGWRIPGTGLRAGFEARAGRVTSSVIGGFGVVDLTATVRR